MPSLVAPKILKALAFAFLFYVLCSMFYVLPVWSQEAVPAQETAFDRQYSDYQAQIKEYELKHSDYILKRSQYLRFKTLTSQEDAIDATGEMLFARADVVASYLKTLKEKLKEGEDIPADFEARITVSIDDELVWLSSHKGETATAETLKDLEGSSLESSERFSSSQNLAFYETLSAIALGKVLGYEKRTQDLFDGLKKKLDEIRSDSRDEYSFSSNKFQILDRWMFDAETRIERSKQRSVSVSTLFSQKNTKSKRTNALSLYNQTLTTLGQSQLYLKEANTFMGEVIRELKTAEK